jgi:hypothetical protein
MTAVLEMLIYLDEFQVSVLDRRGHRQVFGKSLATNITSRTASQPQLHMQAISFTPTLGNTDKVVCTVEREEKYFVL